MYTEVKALAHELSALVADMKGLNPAMNPTRAGKARRLQEELLDRNVIASIEYGMGTVVYIMT